MNYAQIVWLASYPKSGNTWLRLLLDAYYLNDVDINEIVTSVGDDNSIRSHVLPDYEIKGAPVDIQLLTRPMNLLRLVLAFDSNSHADVPLFVKTHFSHTIANGIETLPASLTKATIYMVRDPRDVAISFAKHMGLDIDAAIEKMNDTYNVLESPDVPKLADFISSWGKNVHGYTYADTHNVKVFKYEDLRSDTAGTFAEILRHAGVTPDMDRVKKAVELTDIKKMQQMEAEKGFRETSPNSNFFGKGKIGGWKEKLTPAQLRKIEKYFGLMMKRLGYIDKRRAA